MIFGRAAQHGFSSLTSALSLSVALYKPYPQLPSGTSSVSTTNGQSAVANSANSFIGQSSAKTQNPFSNSSEWGVPSTLYVPKNDSGLYTHTKAHSLAANTVGPGGCPLNTGSYSPKYTLSDSPSYAAFDPVKATMMRYRQQVGVNLGGWFVQEGWMETDFMSCATGDAQSEYSLMSGFGTTTNGVKSAQYYMEQHWDTLYTEDDFKQMALIGINTVRLPIGYWSVGPYFCQNSTFSAWGDVYTNSYKYIARAINWAAKYDIGVLVDLHGAYGSQNGQPHSGISGNVGFFTTSNMQQTTDLLTWLSWELSGVTNVVGIQLLNEPVNNSKLWTWYNSTMNAMRTSSKYAQTVPLYFHDAFVISRGAKLTASRSDFVVQDNHAYYVYTASDQAESADGHTADISSGSVLQSFQSASATGRGNLIVGEYSCALAPGSLSGSDDPVGDEKAYCQAQQAMYLNNTGGQIFWSYYMENCDYNQGWCLQSALGYYTAKVLGAWGFSGYTQNRKVLLSMNSSISTSHSIVSQIATLTNGGNGASAKTIGLSMKTVSFDITTDDNQKLGSSKTKSFVNTGYEIAPLLSLEYDGTKTSTKAKRSLIDDTTGVGSGAARARSLVRAEPRDNKLCTRASTQVTLAQEAGYSDGFLSVTYFAASMSNTTPLSKLGFREQYMMDSWAKRVAANGTAYTTANYGSYEKQFVVGMNEAEDTIRSIVNNAPFPSSK